MRAGRTGPKESIDRGIGNDRSSPGKIGVIKRLGKGTSKGHKQSMVSR